MAKLIFRSTDSPLSQGYKDGDLVEIFPDGHVFGSSETAENWVNSGRLLEDWHAKLILVDIPGSVEDLSALLYAGFTGAGKPSGANVVRRQFKTDVNQLERRDVSFYSQDDLVNPSRPTAMRLGESNLEKPIRRDTLRAYNFVERVGSTLLLPYRTVKPDTVEYYEESVPDPEIPQ